MSNMIKAYSIRYKEEVKKIDVSAKEGEIHSRVADSILESSFEGGLQAITLTEDGEVPAIADYAPVSEGEAGGGELPESAGDSEEVAVEGNPVRETVERTVMSEAYMEAWREAEREKLREEAYPAAEAALRNQAAIDKIVELEDLKVASDEMAQALAVISRQNNITVEQLKEQYDAALEQAVINSVLTGKVMQLIRAAATVEE